MARVLSSASSQYLSGTKPVSAFPFTIAGWVRVSSSTTNLVTWSMYQSGSSNYLYGLAGGAVAGDPFRVDVYPNSVAPGTAATSTGFTANTWHHMACVLSSASNFACFIDGGGKGTNSGNYTGTFANASTFTFGKLEAFGGTYYNSSDVALWGCWSEALTDDEIASLSLGRRHPRMVRPGSLVACWDLGGFGGENDLDRVGGYHLTATGSPTFADGPPIYYPSGPRIVVPGGGAPSVTGNPWNYYAQQA